MLAAAGVNKMFLDEKHAEGHIIRNGETAEAKKIADAEMKAKIEGARQA